MWFAVHNNVAVHQLFIDFKKAHDLVSLRILLVISFTEFDKPMELVSLHKMCLNETVLKSG